MIVDGWRKERKGGYLQDEDGSDGIDGKRDPLVGSNATRKTSDGDDGAEAVSPDRPWSREA